MQGWVPAALYVLCCTAGVWGGWCPWDDTDLGSWGEASTWPDNRVPGHGDRVTIPSGTRVRLDTQPANLSSLTIEGGAALIWGDVDGLVLDTHFMLVKGEFFIGSKTCRFTKDARIRLHGLTNDTLAAQVDEDGDTDRKVIGVARGGTLELHGRKKTAWTKLAQTVTPPHHVHCALVYDHSDVATNLMAAERQQGLHVIVWNNDGSVMDFKVFKVYDDFGEFFETIPVGKVVGMFAYGNNGIGVRNNRRSDVYIGKLELTIVALGGSLITETDKGDSYSFLAKIGDPTTAREFTKIKGQKEPAPAGFLHYHDSWRKLVFQVSSSASESFQYFRVMHDDIAYPVLTLVDEVVGWSPGDEVVVMSTDYDWKQAETRRIVRCGVGCSRRQIRVDDSFNYVHYGNFTRGVDERGEVAILSRNIVIEGVMQDDCYYNSDKERKLCREFDRDTFGGHIKIVRGFDSVHIRGVELTHMGQQNHLGAYPMHFHMVDEARQMYLRENSVHDTFSRCITVHGTNYLEVSDNVCYKHLGHGVFIEDGVEQFNTFQGNLVAGTMYGTLLLSDMSKDSCKINQAKWVENCGDLSSYWITHPNNVFRGNVAAGSDGHGFMYVFADEPLGPSLARQAELGIAHHPKDFPLSFTRNVAHSNWHSGVFMDSKVSTGTGIENKGYIPLNGIIQMENEYDPHVNGQPVWTDMSYGTYYKNADKNMWVKGGNIRVSFSTMADSPQGFTGGTTLFDTGTEVFKCVFIGETENTGMDTDRSYQVNSTHRLSYQFDRSFPGQPTESLTAVSLYQGPNFVRSCFFDHYVTKTWCLDSSLTTCYASRRLTRHAGAISFKRANTYPTMTSSYVVNNTFGFCDNEDGVKHWVFQGNSSVSGWQTRDGTKAVFFRDKDGLLTGTVNASVVPDFPLYKGPQCLDRPDWGNMMVCPYRYVKLEVLGSGGNLEEPVKSDYPMIIRRDDSPYDVPFTIKGEIRNEYLLRTHRSFIIDFNDTYRQAAFPSEYKLFGYGVERGDVVRVGICQPLDVDSFTVYTDYPAVIRHNNASWVSSLAELDADTTGAAFFHDRTNGILFFKMMSWDTDTNETQQCPDGKCWRAKVTVHGGTLGTLRSCANIHIPPLQDNQPTPQKPTVPPCPGIATPQGLGSVSWNDVDFVVHENYTVTCPLMQQPPRKSVPKHMGCFAEKSGGVAQPYLATTELLELAKSMTTDFCINRCYYRGYRYAGLSRGRRCTCGKELAEEEDYGGEEADCDLKCVGGGGGTCGGSKYLDVWTTGKFA